MARRRLADVLGPSPFPSVSILDASGVGVAERRREAEKRWEERIMKESGKVTVTNDPGAFEWVSSRRVTVATPTVRFDGSVIQIRGIDELEEWVGKAVEIGLAAKAVAFRLSPTGQGWKLRRNYRVRSPRFRMSMPTGVRRELQRRGWPFGVPLPAAWDEQHQMVVVKMPKDEGRER